jgi:hypothetical protein
MVASDSKHRLLQQDAAKPFDLDEALYERLGLRSSSSKPMDMQLISPDGFEDALRDRIDEMSLL